MRTRMRWAIGLAAVVAMFAAGCGGGGDDDRTGSTTRATSADTTTRGDDDTGDDPRSEDELADDQSAAEAALPTLDDFPEGWSSKPADDESDAGDDALADCLGLTDEERAATIDSEDPKGTSPTFVAPDESEVDVEVTLTASASVASDDIHLLTGDDLPDCFAEALETSLQEGGDMPDGVEFGDVTVEDQAAGDVGDEAASLRVTLPLTADGEQHQAIVDTYLIRVGRAGIQTTFTSLDEPFTAEDAATVNQLVADRLGSSAADRT